LRHPKDPAALAALEQLVLGLNCDHLLKYNHSGARCPPESRDPGRQARAPSTAAVLHRLHEGTRLGVYGATHVP
jgi:hypothetical protein